jgi:hypothetical protein
MITHFAFVRAFSIQFKLAMPAEGISIATMTNIQRPTVATKDGQVPLLINLYAGCDGTSICSVGCTHYDR